MKSFGSYERVAWRGLTEVIAASAKAAIFHSQLLQEARADNDRTAAQLEL
jgi:hypothetical protein